RPRSTAADTAILQAALDLFIERGLDGVGIEQVAEKARVARTTVYRRWSSKELIVAEAIAQRRGGADEDVLRNPVSPQATLKGVVDALAENVSSPRYRQMVARLIGSVPDQPDLMAIYLRTYLMPRRKVAADALELARAKGLVREDADGEILLDLISGAIIYRLFLYPGDYSERDIRTYLRKVLKELQLEVLK
ncbi:MAG: TetR/AcrR family transcriptional regulator, partial [Spirochaetia bacterium]